MESYIVTCGQYSAAVEIDQEPYEEKEDLFMEVASQALESYFKLNKDDHLLLSNFTTVLHTEEEDEGEAFVLMTRYILVNIGRHDLVRD